MIRAILFDLDRTLVDRDSAIDALFRRQWQRVRDCGATERDESAFVERLLALDNRGLANKTEMYARIVEEFQLPSSLASELEHDFRANYGRTVGLFPDTLSTLQRLRDKGYRLGIITNGTEKVQRAKIETTGLGKFVDTILISETEGIKKPDPEIFQRALQRLDVAAAEALMIGDNLAVDVGGAKAVGMHTMWFAAQEPVALWPVMAIRSLSELEELLNEQALGLRLSVR